MRIPWLALSLLLAFGGCARVHKSADPGPEPIAAATAIAADRTAPQDVSTAEPNHPGIGDPRLEPVEPSGLGEGFAEPNEPVGAEIAEEVAVAVEPTDANQVPLEEPAVVGPNEAPAVEPQEEEAQVAKESPDPIAAFYHEYGELLDQYVRGDGHVDYDSLRRKRLWIKTLLRAPDELDPNVYRAWSSNEALAFWINTYNLKMLDVIVRNYPIESSWWLRLTWPPSDIRHIEGIWSDYRFIVMDEEFTLGEVERRFFHRTFGDPRAFLAISYASRSGPRLGRQPYRGDELHRQLDEQVRTFLSTGQGFRIDRDQGVVYLSALFKPAWRGKEFVARYGTDKKFKDRPPETRAVLNFLTRYVGDEDVYFLEVENYALEYTNFDWRLNDASRRP